MYTLSTNPIPRNKVLVEEPPALKNGSVTPITGIKQMFIPMLIKVWAIKVANIPMHR